MSSTETLGDILPHRQEFNDTVPLTDEALRIIDVIGVDCAITLESDTGFIDFYEELRQIENPFMGSVKNPIDLSIVDSKTADLVNEFRDTPDPFRLESAKKGIFRASKERRLFKFARATQTTCNAAKNLLVERVNDLGVIRGRVLDLSPVGDSKPKAEDVDNFQYENTITLIPQQFQEISGQLTDIASGLPGSETPSVLKQISGKVHDYFKTEGKLLPGGDRLLSGDTMYIQRAIIERAAEVTDSINNPLIADIGNLVKSSDELNTQVLRTIEDGKKSYDLLNAAIDRQKYLFALSTIKTAKIAMSNIRILCESNPDSDQINVLRLSEEFVRERVNIAADIVRANLSSEERYKFNQSIKFEFNESEVSMAEERKNLAEKQTDPEIFSGLVTEARDILKGGRRLVKYGNEKRIQELADQLRQLRDKNRVGETRVLEVEECGLIIATIIGRFRDFTETQAHIKMDHPDRGLHDLEKQRPEEIKLIRGFNLPGAMKKIDSLINSQNTRDLLTKVLNQDELSALKDALSQYHIETEQNMAEENQRLSEAV
jgi:hypothetical protein